MSPKLVLKFIVQNHIGLPIFNILRLFYTPSQQMRKSLLFTGRFQIKTQDGKALRLFNNRFYLETNFFWLGFENHDWEISTRRLWVTLCQNAEVIFDIGANTGIYALLTKTYNSTAQVYAFEPQANIYTVLSRNNLLNGFDITCEMIALSDKEGRQAFYNYGENTFRDLNTTAGSLNKDWKPEGQYSTEVNVERLDSYIAKKQIPKIDLLKIDVETLEFEVLNGYGKLLLLHRPTIILEIQTLHIGARIESLFEGQDFSFFNIGKQEGLIRVERMGSHEGDNKNYLICPNEKLSLI